MDPMMLHQIDDIDWWWKVGRGLLANEPGLGKTRSAIEATKDMTNVLVVAPALVLAGGVWQNELERWSDNPEHYVFASYTSINDRIKTGKTASSSKPISRPRPEFAGPWEAMILDEAHYIKGRDTSWTKVVHQLGKQTELVLPMTGTPIPNWTYEVFTTLQLLFPEESKPGARFGSFWRWAGEWFDTTPTRFSNGAPAVGNMLACDPTCRRRPPHIPCDHYKAFVRENFGQHYRRVWRSQVLDLPPVTEQIIWTPMSEAQAKIYRQLKKDFVAEYPGGRTIAWNQGSLNVMLDKVTTSHTLLTGRNYHHASSMGTKLEQLKADLQQRSRATLVLAHYQDSVDACHEVALEAGLRSARIHGGTGTKAAGEAIRQFREGELDVLVGSLEMVAEGHTLTVADMAIFVEISWKTYRNEQARFRIDRLGQTRPVTIKYYITPGTVDEHKRAVVQAKSEDQIRAMTAAEFINLV